MLPLDTLVFEDRVPVLSVGSNACPAQLVHKMAERGVECRVPMVKARVTGIGIGVSAHVSLLGYLSASPFRSPNSTSELFLTWLDEAQLAVVDASEGVDPPTGNFQRAALPAADFRVELESGDLLDHAWIYVNRWGVLRDGGPARAPTRAGSARSSPNSSPRRPSCVNCSAPPPRSSAPGRAVTGDCV